VSVFGDDYDTTDGTVSATTFMCSISRKPCLGVGIPSGGESELLIELGKCRGYFVKEVIATANVYPEGGFG